MDFDAGKAYRLLFNGITDAIMKLDAGKPQDAKRLLVWCQRMTEEQYVTAPQRLTKAVPFSGKRHNREDSDALHTKP